MEGSSGLPRDASQGMVPASDAPGGAERLSEQLHSRLEAGIGLALVGALESANTGLEATMLQPCITALIAGSVAANIAIANSPMLRRAWLAASPDLAGVLRVFSLFALSFWLCSQDGARALRQSKTSRRAWGEKLLSVFGELSPGSLRRFEARDRQIEYEMQKQNDPSADTIALVTTNLLCSDASEMLGGEPLAEGLPDQGYPYESTHDLMRAAAGPAKWVPDAVDINVMTGVRSTIAALVTGDAGKRPAARRPARGAKRSTA